MKKLQTAWLASLVAMVVNPPFASAQSAIEVYVHGAAGMWHSERQAQFLVGGAGGAEWLMAPYFGVGGEAGVLTNARGGLLMSTGADGRVHFGDRHQRAVTPYAFAGYSRLHFFEGADDALQYGFGIDHRQTARRSVRIELRDYYRMDHIIPQHYWTVRFGVTFRRPRAPR